jgi:nicotinate-nucleotide--dimethylbenzimidazole phosphoribosyltransferase
MSAPGRPFDDFRALIAAMPGPDERAQARARGRFSELGLPTEALGRLEEIAVWLAGWQGGSPHVDAPLVAVFAANHGVVGDSVAPNAAARAKAMIANSAAGGSAINQICKTFDLSLRVFELALDHPIGDIAREPALDERACAATMAFGMEALAARPDLLCLGEMGIGGDILASAVCCALYGGAPEAWVGFDDAEARGRAEIVRAAIAAHRDHLSDPFEVLRRLGGREIAAMVGAILAARIQGAPVLLDGFVAGAAAAVLSAIDPRTLDHCMAAQVSPDRAHAELLARFDKKPLLDLGLRLGEGAGAALAVGIVKAAVACHNGMASVATT